LHTRPPTPTERAIPLESAPGGAARRCRLASAGLERGDLGANADEVRPYGYRWVLLLALMFINVTIQILWICFAPVAGQAATYYGVSELQVGLLAMVFMIVYIPVSIPASWAIDTFGPRMAMQISVVFIYAMGWLDGVLGSLTPSPGDSLPDAPAPSPTAPRPDAAAAGPG
jgi:hypothetical protein